MELHRTKRQLEMLLRMDTQTGLLLAERALYLAKAAGRDRVIAAWQMAQLDEPRDRRRYDRPGAAEADVARRASGA